MPVKRFITSAAAAVVMIGCAMTAACARTDVGATAGGGTSHVLFADSLLRVPKKIQSITVSVQANSSYNTGTRKYTYTYVVTNDSSSAGHLDTFGLAPLPTACVLSSPPHWDGGMGWEGDSTLAGWSVAEGDTTTPLPPNDTGNLYPSPYDVGPGGSIGLFAIVSDKPPTTVNFYAQAFDTLSSGDDDVGSPILSQEGVTGTILGPDRSYVASVGGSVVRRGGVDFRPPAPNPAMSSVSLTFEMPSRATVSLDIIDLRGARVRQLVHGPIEAGITTVTWNGLDARGGRVAPGVYFFRLSTGDGPGERRRVVVIR